MMFVQMNNSRFVNKGLAEQNYYKKDEEKYIRNGVEGDGQDLSEEDELQINEDVEGALHGHKELGQVQDHASAEAVFHRSEKQQEGPFVCWERFLPLRSLKVLLVENDDSTRQVVGALLRNCGYEVMAVANGLQAWRILEDLTNRVDLVLTEVVMPCLSGVGLLSKIMSHKTCKNIPVIMMSSHDSMNIVFKCLSKGAVDFLVKPIRKNELKNLWQHIWRKCHSSSGSGSESGIQTEKSIKSKSCEESDNNTASNDEDDMESISLNAKDGSDNGSGTQSSWTKKAVEIDSPKRMSSWDQVGDPPDSTCLQVIHSRPEAFSSNWVHVTANRDQDELENDVMGKNLEIGASRNPNLQIDEPGKKMLTEMAGTNGEDISDIDSKNDKRSKNKQLELNSETINKESYNQVTSQPGAITNSTDPHMESIVFNIPRGSSKVPEVKDKHRYNNEEMPCLELSLKRTRDVQHLEGNAHDRNVLRHSGLSAFSRYMSTATPNQAPTGNVGSCSPAENSSKAAKTDSMQNFQSNSNSPPPNQGSNGSSNNNDIGSTTNNAVTKPPTISDKSASKSVAKCLHPSSAFQPVQNVGIIPPNIQGKTDAALANMIFTQSRGMNQHIQVQHHHHHHHYHLQHQHFQNMAKLQADHDDISLEKFLAAAPQCGSSNMLSTPSKCATANHSLNGSASGSNHGSNGQNSSIHLNGHETNNDGDNKIDVKGGGMAGIGYESTNGVDQSRNAQREAALQKFRQKRKDRCFEKKVRYHSRKKLAEQRPRIRGQFVRQVIGDNKGKEASQTTKA